MTQLGSISVASNSLSGPLPEKWSGLLNVKTIGLEQNHFTGAYLFIRPRLLHISVFISTYHQSKLVTPCAFRDGAIKLGKDAQASRIGC